MSRSQTRDIAELLQSHGVSPTRQRMAVGEVLLSAPRHLCADQVREALDEDGQRVSKATVYNTLNLFVERGLAREVIVDPSRVFYDSTVHPHHHLYDTETGELVDLDSAAIAVDLRDALPPEVEVTGVEVIVRVRGRS